MKVAFLQFRLQDLAKLSPVTEIEEMRLSSGMVAVFSSQFTEKSLADRKCVIYVRGGSDPIALVMIRPLIWTLMFEKKAVKLDHSLTLPYIPKLWYSAVCQLFVNCVGNNSKNIFQNHLVLDTRCISRSTWKPALLLIKKYVHNDLIWWPLLYVSVSDCSCFVRNCAVNRLFAFSAKTDP